MSRAKFISYSILIFYVILVMRLLYIHHNHKNVFGIKNHTHKHEIVDCNQEILAFTETTTSIYKPKKEISTRSAELLKTYFNIDITKKKFWIKRHLNPQEITLIKNLNIKDIGFSKDVRRIYPYSKSTSHIIGYCDQNLHGKSGAELAFNDKLAESKLILTIDVRIQNIFYNIIKEIYHEFESEDASAILIDIKSGAIKAMASYPAPDSNVPSSYLVQKNKNHHLSAVEVGSILKLHNAAMCLENDLVTLDSQVDATGTLKINEFEINDFFGQNTMMSFIDSVRFSSNIATGRLALEAGLETQKSFFKTMGMLDKIEWLPNHFAYPSPPKKWRKSNVVTISYGYGIGLTSMHVVQGLMRIITGQSRSLYLYHPNTQNSNKILQDTTSHDIKIIMRHVIKSSYSGINIPGYEIGGKTGTANMCENGKYIEGKNRVAYLGAFPMNDPQYIFLIQTTNPKKSKLKRGRFTVASNVLTQKVKTAIQEIASIHNVEPVRNT